MHVSVKRALRTRHDIASMAGRRLRSRRIATAQEEIVKGVTDVVHEVLRNVSESPTADVRAGSGYNRAPVERGSTSSELLLLTS